MPDTAAPNLAKLCPNPDLYDRGMCCGGECFADRDDELDGPEPGEECGRWVNGRLGRYCSKVGSEECDFECPYRSSLR